MNESEMVAIVAQVEQYGKIVAEFTQEDVDTLGRSYLGICVRTCQNDHKLYYYDYPTLVMRYSSLPGAWVRTFSNPYSVFEKITHPSIR